MKSIYLLWSIAKFPETLLFSFKLLVTTAPKLILELFPIISPLETVAPIPNQQSSPIIVLPPIVVLDVIKHLLPTFTAWAIWTRLSILLYSPIIVLSQG